MLLRSVRFATLGIKVINLSRRSGKQEERQIRPHHWAYLWWPELRVTKVCPLFCQTLSLEIYTKTENAGPLLPYWKTRHRHIQQGCDGEHQLPSECLFTLSRRKLSFKHSVKEKWDQLKKCFLISCWKSGLGWCFMYFWRWVFQIIRYLLHDYVISWAFTLKKKKVQEKSHNKKVKTWKLL